MTVVTRELDGRLVVIEWDWTPACSCADCTIRDTKKVLIPLEKTVSIHKCYNSLTFFLPKRRITVYVKIRPHETTTTL